MIEKDVAMRESKISAFWIATLGIALMSYGLPALAETGSEGPKAADQLKTFNGYRALVI